MASAPSKRAPGLVLGDGVVLGEDIALGANVVIEDRTAIGAQCTIEHHVVLGKQPRLGPRSTAAHRAVDRLVIERGVSVCAGAVVYAGAHLEEGVIIGDQAQVRERAHIGPQTVVGRGAGVDNDVVIGARVRIQSQVYVTGYSVVEDDVFLGPGALLTNDDTMGRHPSGTALQGPILRRACRIGGGAVICPGVEVGEEAFVAAGAVVTRDVSARAVVMGVPARAVREVGEDDLLEQWR